jgi:hypothetical protein
LLGLVVLVAAAKLLADKVGTSIGPARLPCARSYCSGFFANQYDWINSLFLNI